MSGTGRLDIGCKADALLVGARYDPEDGHLVLAQAYERRGALWTDAVILDRGARLARLRTGRRVVVGEVDPEVLGDFAVLSRLGLQPADGREHLLLGESSTGRDNLGVPSF